MFLLMNIVLFTFIFWMMMFLTKFFYYKDYFNNKKIFYECGFKAYEVLNMKMNIIIIMFFILLLLYDLEFFLIIPNFMFIFKFNIFWLFFFLNLIFIMGILMYYDNILMFIYWNNLLSY